MNSVTLAGISKQRDEEECYVHEDRYLLHASIRLFSFGVGKGLTFTGRIYLGKTRQELNLSNNLGRNAIFRRLRDVVP